MRPRRMQRRKANKHASPLQRLAQERRAAAASPAAGEGSAVEPSGCSSGALRIRRLLDANQARETIHYRQRMALERSRTMLEESGTSVDAAPNDSLLKSHSQERRRLEEKLVQAAGDAMESPSGGVETSMPAKVEAAKVPYREQMNRKFHTDGALAARDQLRDHPAVVGAIDRLWTAVTRYNIRKWSLSRTEYTSLNMLIQKALDTEGDFNPFVAEQQAAMEWLRDSTGAGAGRTMKHSTFHDSIFELVDIWTSEISAAAYSSFLFQLVQRITCIVVDFDDSPIEKMRTHIQLPHTRAGAQIWLAERRKRVGQPYSVRYAMTWDIDDVQSWCDHKGEPL
jgi:hypothetical protein